MPKTDRGECPDLDILQAEYQSARLVLLPKGEIDHHSAAQLRARMDRLLYQYRPKKCCIDLEKTSFMDSAGLGLLMGRYTCAVSLGAEFSVKNPSAQISKIIALSGMDRLIPIEGTPAERDAKQKKKG